MPKDLFIHRYLLIINRLQKSPANFAQINNYLQRESDIAGIDHTISLRTFQREKKEIEKLGYNIQFDKKLKVYSIANGNDNEKESNRIVEALQLLDLLKTAARYKNVIHFDNRKPQGLHHLPHLLKAIQNQLIIKLEYQNFYEDVSCSRELYPLGIKECQSRWYLIAKDTFDSFIKTYGLDRIVDFDITKKKFSKNEQEMNNDYNDCFGIIKPVSGKPQTLRLAFETLQGKYVITNPLHSSQKIIQNDSKGLVIELKVFITHDLVMELLSYGSTLKVLAPKILITQMTRVYKAALKNYLKE